MTVHHNWGKFNARWRRRLTNAEVVAKVGGFSVKKTLLPSLAGARKQPAHSKKFKMNEEVDSFLSEKVSNLLLT